MPTYDYGDWFLDIVDYANRFGCSAEEFSKNLQQMYVVIHNSAASCNSHAGGRNSVAAGDCSYAYGINNTNDKDIALMGGWIEEDDNVD